MIETPRLFLASGGLGALPGWLASLPVPIRRAALVPTAATPLSAAPFVAATAQALRQTGLEVEYLDLATADPGQVQRTIEAGAGRSTSALVADVRASAARFTTAYSLMPADAWQHMVRWTTGRRCPAARIADARLCEVLVHHVDLRVGFTPADWPAAFVAYELDVVIAAFGTREDAPSMRVHATDTDVRYDLSAGDGAPVIRGRQASLLAWLMGRSAGDDLSTDDDRALPAPPFLY